MPATLEKALAFRKLRTEGGTVSSEDVQHHGAGPIVSHLIGALGFGEWKNVVWAGIPDALLLAVHLFYLFITFNFETIIGSVVVAKIVQRGLVYPSVSSPGFILHNYSTVSKPGI